MERGHTAPAVESPPEMLEAGNASPQGWQQGSAEWRRKGRRAASPPRCRDTRANNRARLKGAQLPRRLLSSRPVARKNGASLPRGAVIHVFAQWLRQVKTRRIIWPWLQVEIFKSRRKSIGIVLEHRFDF